MKPGNQLTIILLLLLTLAGCGRKEKTDIPSPRKPLEIAPIESRLQNISVIGHQNKIIELIEKDTLPYYIPGYPLGKLESIKALANDLDPEGYDNPVTGYKAYQSFSNHPLLKAGKTSQDVYFTAIFDNDIIDYTDRYYTNGAGFELFHPIISASLLVKLLPGLNFGINYYGLILIQNLYTPLKLNKAEILVGDRPFASYLTLGHQRISLSPETKRRLYSEFTLGVIGPGSLGNFSQSMIHAEEPTGWKYQVQNDFIANYTIRFDQGIYSKKGIEVAIVAAGQAGTLYDNLSAGIFLQLGNANDRYCSVFQTTDPQKPFKKRIRYYFSLDLTNKLIIYDATLQGGMFNNNSVYTIDPENLNRYVFTGTAGFGIGFGKYSLEADQVFLTPEFEGGRRHLWFRIKNIIRLN
jgi:hypothetical protein